MPLLKWVPESKDKSIIIKKVRDSKVLRNNAIFEVPRAANRLAHMAYRLAHEKSDFCK